MPWDYPENARADLHNALQHGNLTLYLGAGVSAASGLPTWEKLLLTVYFEKISTLKLPGLRPFPNYLFAIADWYLRERREPPELVARKLRQLFEEDAAPQDSFVNAIGQALYGGRYAGGLSDDPEPDIYGNKTLSAVSSLCTYEPYALQHGVRSVITYNYDDLLEQTLTMLGRDHQPVFNETPAAEDHLPIFHVHGFLPFSGVLEDPSQIVLSEQEYNTAASDPYTWSNLVQLREMSNSVGLMVGLSVTDRNIRRLLDVLRQSPVRPKIYALMSRPEFDDPDDEQVDRIDEDARGLVNEFRDSGVKVRQMGEGHVFSGAGTKGGNYRREIRKIVAAVDDLTEQQELSVLESLGIRPIWYDSHDDIPHIIEEIRNAP